MTSREAAGLALVTVDLPQSLLDHLYAEARRCDMSVSHVVAQALRSQINDNEETR